MQKSTRRKGNRLRPVANRPKRQEENDGGESMPDTSLEESIRFYKEVFGITLDTKDLRVPEPVDERVKNPLIMLGGKKFLREALKKSAAEFGVIYTGLGHRDCGLCVKCRNSLIRSIACNARGDSEDPYVILVEDSYEPSMQYANKQLCEIEEQDIQGMTLAERLIFGLWFHWKHGKHVDVYKSTLCSGTYVEHEEEDASEANLGASFVVYCLKELNGLVIMHVDGEGRAVNRAPRLVVA